MSEQIEIEYKTLLTAEQFQAIKAKYAPNQAAFVQENYYFDTPHFDLKHKHCGLRIRRTENSAECTLKTPLSEGLLETTDKLTIQEAEEWLSAKKVPNKGSVAEKLTTLDISISELQLLAQLKTARIQIVLPIGELALDESWYGDNHDYELELEVPEANQGKQDFLSLLEEFQIDYQPAKNKIVRAFEATIV